jgi:hypothetical protein
MAKSMTQSQPKAGPSNAAKAATAKPQQRSGYKGSNFDPNYSQQYQEKSQQGGKGEEKREQKK